jgi:rhomboid protease GluP
MLIYLIPKEPHVATSVILNINILVCLAMIFSGVHIMSPNGVELMEWGANRRVEVMGGEWWRLITSMFVHGGIVHLLFNMYTLYIFGQVLEPMLGRARFLALYLIAAFGGSVAVLLFSNPASSVVGASGAIYGLMGAYFVLLRAIGERSGQLTGLIAINLIFSFISPGISWQAHIGGLLVGAAVAAIYSATRKPEQKTLQGLGLLVLIAGLIVLTMNQVSNYQIA